jgi:Protein of unknown function (DUF3102)
VIQHSNAQTHCHPENVLEEIEAPAAKDIAPATSAGIKWTFDYNCLAPADAASLRQHANKLHGLIAKSTADMIEVGRDLRLIKDQLEHGQFTAWVEQEIGISIRTAQTYMQMARLAEGKNETVSLLPPSTVRILAAKSASPEVIQQVMSRVDSGDIVPESAVKEMISDDREIKRNAKREAERAALNARRPRAVRERRDKERLEWQAKVEQERAKNCTQARSIIDRLSPEDVRFLAETLTYEVVVEFLRLVEGGAA